MSVALRLDYGYQSYRYRNILYHAKVEINPSKCRRHQVAIPIHKIDRLLEVYHLKQHFGSQEASMKDYIPSIRYPRHQLMCWTREDPAQARHLNP